MSCSSINLDVKHIRYIRLILRVYSRFYSCASIVYVFVYTFLFSFLQFFRLPVNYDIPKDTDIIINHWALHHDPDKWTDVDTFIPERFLDADGKLGPKPESWLPFSAGRRVCLGESVAKPELHLLFATLMHRYTWQAPEGGTIVVKGNETFGVITPLSQKLQITKRFK